MRRFPMFAFAALIVATIAAFFITQHLKVTTPLITGVTGPTPAVINPVSGITCYDASSHRAVSHRTTTIAFYLLHQSDAIDLYVVNTTGARVDTLVTGRYMRRDRKVPVPFVWDGREQNGSIAPDGTYYFRVYLIHQNRTVTFSDNSGPLPLTVTMRSRCP